MINCFTGTATTGLFDPISFDGEALFVPGRCAWQTRAAKDAILNRSAADWSLITREDALAAELARLREKFG